MKGCLIALGIPVGLMILVIGLFWLNFYDVHVRYRLTVEVMDGDQIKTGSSVIEASYAIQPTWSWAGPENHTPVVGCAPTVDLGEKGMLFLTFSNPVSCAANDLYCLPFEAYGEPGTGVATDYSKRKTPLDELLLQSGPRNVPFAHLTKLVRFRDINDPRTTVDLSPNNLAAYFGPGVELKRVVLQLTDDPITPPPKIWPQWLTIRRQNTNFRGYEAQ
jgi:hypothetical protein